MPSVYDFLALVAGSIGILAGHRQEFAATLGVALALAGLGGYGAANYSRLWNLQFRATAAHAVLCFVAAVLTFLFAVLFASLKYTQDAAELSIDAWRAVSQADRRWQDAAWRRAYDTIKQAGVEDFSNVPGPDRPGVEIPLAHTASRAQYAGLVAAAAIDDFKASRPFLSKIVWLRFAVPQQAVERIEKRISQFFASEGLHIPLAKVVEFTAEALKEPLYEGVARVVPVARGIVAALFLLVQLVPFGLIGWAAWRDLKVTV
jgi:hypothetical protein